MTTNTTLRLPLKLQRRIAGLGRKIGCTAEDLVFEMLDREIEYGGKWGNFIREALASDADIGNGAAIYRAQDVHRWLEQLAQKRRAVRPKLARS